MGQYNSTNISKIFWAASDGFKSGRDPMGIQNSSIATYATLLPGMTNLTGHIRYYSLYCWLLDEYAKLDSTEIERIHQYNFIRRAELIMAFIMHNKNVNSVIGSDFVLRKKESLFTEGVIDIALGADYQNKDKYWSYQSGALGQYYLGSLLYYNLIAVKDNAFYVTENEGASLCDALKDSVSENVRNLFVKRIIEGKLYLKDIDELESAGLTSIRLNSAEWNGLNNLMVKSDVDGLKISTFRKESIYLMLKDLQNEIPFSEFIENRYKSFDTDTDEPNAEFGWFFYYLCEVLHYSIDTLFCYILTQIEKLKNPPIEVLLEISSDEIVTLINEHKNGIIEPDKTRFVLIDSFHTIQTQIKKRNYSNAVVTALLIFEMIFTIYQDNKESFEKFEAINDLKRQRGILSSGLKDYYEKHRHKSQRERVYALFQQVMNEHCIVSVNKMGYNDYDLRKFIIEDGCAVLVEIRYPNLTNPRINSLHNYLRDLYYINDEDVVTEIGKKFIESYGK